MRIKFTAFILLFFCVILTGCREKKDAPNPWGNETASGEEVKSSTLQLDDIISNGELIMVTISGPETYYDYHGHGMGLHYLLCEKFCEKIGVSLRVDVCKDTAEMVKRLRNGEADIIAMPFRKDFPGLKDVAGKTLVRQWHWLVNKDNTTLADTLDHFLTADMVRTMKNEEQFLLSTRSITRHVYSPMQNRAKGVISSYDALFQKYALSANWDWRLLAAQCYQESTFDPRAHSWAGACGLMQIMPSTADEIGLSRAALYDPEQNVAAAVRYIRKLTHNFSDINDPIERMKYVLASYNGGTNHVRDAMALARKHGGSPYRWNDVRTYILRLQQPAYYCDPVVKNGYMRGSETAEYVERIWARWMDYRGVRGYKMPDLPSSSTSSSTSYPTMPDPSGMVPHPSKKRKAKYNL